MFGKNSIIAPPDVVAKYGSPPGGGRISPRQGGAYKVENLVPTVSTPSDPVAALPSPRDGRRRRPGGASRIRRLRGHHAVVIDLTAKDGIRPGSVVSVRRDKIPIVHPVTGEFLGELDEEVATGKVSEVHDKFSVVDVEQRVRGSAGQGQRPRRRPLIRRRRPCESPDASRDAAEGSRVPRRRAASCRPSRRRSRDQIDSPVALIREMGEFIAGAGGKRLRPILLLMAARLAGYGGPRAVRMGCVVELLHTATLIHDDVVDQAPLRRGRPSANARWGDDASVLVGDHLYSKSFALMVQDGDAQVLETLARATVSMTEAEVFQLERKRSGTTGEADYLRIITQKTASFMSACCRIGALLGRCDPEQVEGLTRYGLDIGIAFQMSDDSLDFVADQARLGKAIGADLKEGKRTLPLITTLERASARTSASASRHCSRAMRSIPDEIEEIRRLVVQYDGIEYALEQAHDYAQAAKEALHAVQGLRGQGDAGADRGFRRRPRLLVLPGRFDRPCEVFFGMDGKTPCPDVRREARWRVWRRADRHAHHGFWPA